MNDDILARARRLAEAANIVAAQMSQQADEFMSVSALRQQQVDIEESQAKALESNHTSNKPTRDEIGNTKSFKGAVINGSSLITTYSDIRSNTSRGGTILIDGIDCKIADKGEWSGSRVELEHDFQGPTNLDAIISILITEETIAKKSSPKRNKVVPIATSEINNAVQQLDGLQSSILKNIPMKSSMMNTSKSNSTSTSSTKDRTSKSRVANNTNGHQITTPSADLILPHTEEEVKLYTELRHQELYEQEELERKKQDMNRRIAERGQNKAAIRASKWLKHKHQQQKHHLDVINGDTPEFLFLGHNGLQEGVNYEGEEEGFVNENADGSPTSSNHNSRLMYHGEGGGGGGGGGDNLGSLGGSYVSRVSHKISAEEQRRLANMRVLQRMKQEEEATIRRMEEEERKQREIKAVMEAKAEALRRKTQERVSILLEKKKREEREKAEREKAESRAKEARELNMKTEAQLEKIRRLKLETEERLKQRQKAEQERELQEKFLTDQKLRELAEERGRSVPMAIGGEGGRGAGRSRGADSESEGERPRSSGSRVKVKIKVTAEAVSESNISNANSNSKDCHSNKPKREHRSGSRLQQPSQRRIHKHEDKGYDDGLEDDDQDEESPVKSRFPPINHKQLYTKPVAVGSRECQKTVSRPSSYSDVQKRDYSDDDEEEFGSNLQPDGQYLRSKSAEDGLSRGAKLSTSKPTIQAKYTSKDTMQQQLQKQMQIQLTKNANSKKDLSTVPKYDGDSDGDDGLSDDSLGDDSAPSARFYANKKTADASKNNPVIHGNKSNQTSRISAEETMSIMSSLTVDEDREKKKMTINNKATSNKNTSSVSITNNNNSSKKDPSVSNYSDKFLRKNPKNPVWKMAPIPVQPYVPVPVTNKELR